MPLLVLKTFEICKCMLINASHSGLSLQVVKALSDPAQEELEAQMERFMREQAEAERAEGNRRQLDKVICLHIAFRSSYVVDVVDGLYTIDHQWRVLFCATFFYSEDGLSRKKKVSHTHACPLKFSLPTSRSV